MAAHSDVWNRFLVLIVLMLFLHLASGPPTLQSQMAWFLVRWWKTTTPKATVMTTDAAKAHLFHLLRGTKTPLRSTG